MKNKKFVLIVLIPIFLHLMIFMIGPIIGGLAISFFDYNPLRSDNHFVGLDNFVRLVQDPVFWKATKNTLFFVVITVALNIVISLGIAQLISMFKSNKTRSLFRMIFFLPCVAPLGRFQCSLGKEYFTYHKRTGQYGIAYPWFSRGELAWKP